MLNQLRASIWKVPIHPGGEHVVLKPPPAHPKRQGLASLLRVKVMPSTNEGQTLVTRHFLSCERS